STLRRWAERSRTSGGAAMTSRASVEASHGGRWRNPGTGALAKHGWRGNVAASVPRRLGVALCCQRRGEDRVVRVDVGDGRNADAWRLDDVDGVDADAGPDLARRRGVVSR